jgi:hypothetical protein
MVLKRSCPVLFLLGFAAFQSARGQATNSPSAPPAWESLVAFVNRDAIVTSFVAAPNLGGTDTSGSSSSNTPGQWLKVEFHYGVTPTADMGNFLDEVQFKVIIEGLDPLAPNKNAPDGKGVAVGFTGSVTYVNVPAGRDVYGCFYVHPSTIARYSGDLGAEDYDRKFNIHLEAWVNGVQMDYFDKNKGELDPNWYKALKPIPNLVFRQDQCPFIVSEPDHYPMIKLSTPGQ